MSETQDNVTGSPLAEALPNSLDDILNTDPLKLTEQDRKVVVAYLRRARESFLAQEAGKLPKGVKKASPVAKVALDPTLSADDLELDIE